MIRLDVSWRAERSVGDATPPGDLIGLRRASDSYTRVREPRLLPLPDVHQGTDYTCGPASLRAILALYGLGDIPERRIARIARTSPRYGTEPAALARAAEHFGLRAEVKSGLTIPDLRHHVLSGTAVIVNYQAWRDARLETPWKTHWGDGHYAVVAGVDREYVYLEDPWLVGAHDRIPHGEFLDRWHGGDARCGFICGGVVVSPPESGPES